MMKLFNKFVSCIIILLLISCSIISDKIDQQSQRLLGADENDVRAVPADGVEVSESEGSPAGSEITILD